jgi:hypothetical protein
MLLFFKWCEQTTLGETIRESLWLFPVIEAIHLLGLGIVAGAVLVVNLRLFGTGLSRQPPALLFAAIQPWLVGAVAVMFASGIPLFLAEATKCYYSFAFWVKMVSLTLALLFTFTIQRRVMRASHNGEAPSPARMVALISLGLWFGVAWGGRWIGFS